MGIKGLWKEVASSTHSGHLSQLHGNRLGVDAFGWLHRGALPSATKLYALGEPCPMYLGFFQSRLDLLKAHNITPVLVFDGRAIPMKDGTNKGRQERRRKAREDGMMYLRQHEPEKAARCFEQCIEISPEMVLSAIRLAQARGVHCLVAPFESDAELAYLCKKLFLNGVISEDSDMFCYGCPKVISKLSADGKCCITLLDDVHASDNFFGGTPVALENNFHFGSSNSNINLTTMRDHEILNLAQQMSKALLQNNSHRNNNNNHNNNNNNRNQQQQNPSGHDYSLNHDQNQLLQNSHDEEEQEEEARRNQQQLTQIIADYIKGSQFEHSTAVTLLRFDLFTLICVLSGCDYSASYPGIGIKKAIRIVRKALQVVILKKREQIQLQQQQQQQNNNNQNNSTPLSLLVLLSASQAVPTPMDVLREALIDIRENYANSSSTTTTTTTSSKNNNHNNNNNDDNCDNDDENNHNTSTTTTTLDFDTFAERVHKAFYCFKHHLVWDYQEQKIVPFSELRNPNNYYASIANSNNINNNSGNSALEDVRAILLSSTSTSLSNNQQQQQQRQQPSNKIMKLAHDIVGEVWSKEIGIGVCENFELRASNFKPYNWSGSIYEASYKLYQIKTRGLNQPTIFEGFSNNQNNNNNNRNHNNNNHIGIRTFAVFSNNNSNNNNADETAMKQNSSSSSFDNNNTDGNSSCRGSGDNKSKDDIFVDENQNVEVPSTTKNNPIMSFQKPRRLKQLEEDHNNINSNNNNNNDGWAIRAQDDPTNSSCVRKSKYFKGGNSNNGVVVSSRPIRVVNYGIPSTQQQQIAEKETPKIQSSDNKPTNARHDDDCDEISLPEEKGEIVVEPTSILEQNFDAVIINENNNEDAAVQTNDSLENKKSTIVRTNAKDFFSAFSHNNNNKQKVSATTITTSLSKITINSQRRQRDDEETNSLLLVVSTEKNRNNNNNNNNNNDDDDVDDVDEPHQDGFAALTQLRKNQHVQLQKRSSSLAATIAQSQHLMMQGDHRNARFGNNSNNNNQDVMNSCSTNDNVGNIKNAALSTVLNNLRMNGTGF